MIFNTTDKNCVLNLQTFPINWVAVNLFPCIWRYNLNSVFNILTILHKHTALNSSLGGLKVTHLN